MTAAAAAAAPAGALRGRSVVLLGTALACVLEMLPGLPGALTAPAGLWLLLGAPVAVWRGSAARAVSGRDSSLLLAVGLAVMTDILVALAVDLVLPLFGDAHPLARVPLAGAQAMVLIAVGAFVPEEARRRRAGPRRRPPGLLPVAAVGGVALVLSVAGPVRLNNGYGGAVSTAALVVLAGLLVLLTVRRRRYPAPVLETGLFLAASALLLLNSLRGWYITGHDIQGEYEYFRLTFGGGIWHPSAYPNAYNACLSITLLPVGFVRLTGIPDIYVFKAVLPVLFALTPVLVYRSVRNVAPQLVALLSAVYFLAFPTFFNDMTFLGRQEVAFLLLGCAMVVLTDQGRPLRNRRAAFAVLMVGLVLSHYSTTYVVVLTFGAGFAGDLLWRLADRRRGSPHRRTPFRTTSFITWWLVLLPAALALVWAGPVTRTDGELRSTVAAVYQEVVQGKQASGSSDTSYSLFGGTKVSPQQRLRQFEQSTLAERETEQLQAAADKHKAADYVPLKTAEAYPVALVSQADMPLTWLGRALSAAGLPVASGNSLLRQGASALLQLLLVLGFAIAVRARRGRGFQPLRDQVTLTAGSLVLLALLTVLPQLSVNYGVLRAFQQGLFFFAPFMAAGTLWVLRWAGRRTVPLVCVLVAGLFLDLTGVVPKLLGGYPAQLQLSNAGQYYDVYYPHLTEREAAFWLEQKIASDGSQFLQTDHFTFSRLQTLITGPAEGNLYPTLLNRDAYVLLGTNTVHNGEMTVSYQGDLITFRFPEGILDATKNKIYSSEGAEIYR